MFPTIKGQKFTHLKGTKYESKGGIVDFFSVSGDDKEYSTLSELLAKNPINTYICVFIVGGGAADLKNCTIE